MQIEILDQVGGDRSTELKQQFLKAASTTDLYKTSPFDFKSVIANKRTQEKPQNKPAEQTIQRLILAYDEYPFQYSCKGTSNANVSNFTPMPQVPTSCENFSSFIGIS